MSAELTWHLTPSYRLRGGKLQRQLLQCDAGGVITAWSWFDVDDNGDVSVNIEPATSIQPVMPVPKDKEIPCDSEVKPATQPESQPEPQGSPPQQAPSGPKDT